MDGFIEDLETLDARQLAIAIRKLADCLTYGTDRSPFLGSGIEYAQSRPYQPGDPVRIIDWRVTARTARYWVKDYESPKSMPCYLFVDTSASMTVSSTAQSKYHTALYLAGGIALACLDRVSPVGVIGVGERSLRVAPSMAKHRILQWLLTLRRYRFDEGTSLTARLREITPSLTHRVLMVVLSDLHDPGAIASLKHVAQLHDCVVLQLLDPAEVTLKGSGFLRAREAETGREFVAFGRQRWGDMDRAARELRQSGIDHVVIRTDRPYVHAVRDLFRSRGFLMRGAR
ncbi:MAG: DUF58 domain-containing protein [Planctomycetota bacterium]